MKRNRIKNLILIAFLIAATGAAMAYTSSPFNRVFGPWNSNSSIHHSGNGGVVDIAGQLVQDKILQGSDGLVALALTLRANEEHAVPAADSRHVDMVIVLDRSGSMNGPKINDAREAVLKLISSLSARDRFALVTYSDGVDIASGLVHVTDEQRNRLISEVYNVQAGGGTNLGAGLKVGISLLINAKQNANIGKVILISDGLANKGITDVQGLSSIAAVAVKKEFSISTVGVGADFNEHLMTAIADYGTGNYYYLENPAAFAEVFQKEFFYTRTTTATNLEVRIPLQDGIYLSDAAGYPIKFDSGAAVFYPGNLRSGQTRNLYLTMQLPTDRQRTFELGGVEVRYQSGGRAWSRKLNQSFKIACVNDPRKVFSSIDEDKWSDKVLNEDFNRLKQEVAADIRAGEKDKAMDRIEKYHGQQDAVNAVVGSSKVAENLAKDLKELRTVVEETFQGAPSAVMEKQKSNAKALQYEGYAGRRY
jgi:Ca-activated chloride channel homolog